MTGKVQLRPSRVRISARPRAELKTKVNPSPHNVVTARKIRTGDFHAAPRRYANARMGTIKHANEARKSKAFVQSIRCKREKMAYAPPGTEWKRGSMSIVAPACLRLM